MNVREFYESVYRPVSDPTWQKVIDAIREANQEVNHLTVLRFSEMRKTKLRINGLTAGESFFIYWHWIKEGKCQTKTKEEIYKDLAPYQCQSKIDYLLKSQEFTQPYLYIETYPIYLTILRKYHGLQSTTI